MIWVPCPLWYVASLPVCSVLTVERDAVWRITRTRFGWNTRRSRSSSEERRCSYLTVLLSLQSLNWPQMRNSMLFYRLEIGCIWESLWGEPSSRPRSDAANINRANYKTPDLSITVSMFRYRHGNISSPSQRQTTDEMPFNFLYYHVALTHASDVMWSVQTSKQLFSLKLYAQNYLK